MKPHSDHGAAVLATGQKRLVLAMLAPLRVAPVPQEGLLTPAPRGSGVKGGQDEKAVPSWPNKNAGKETPTGYPQRKVLTSSITSNSGLASYWIHL